MHMLATTNNMLVPTNTHALLCVGYILLGSLLRHPLHIPPLQEEHVQTEYCTTPEVHVSGVTLDIMYM